uniref:S-protein homolog n=1 Tax=Lactuca sativa TaxID=4236 RepID=A0A9R1UCK1_LACSA|nr:hypothetical protein LSAT_V11C900482510 [Lactuca sativa]
MRSSTINKLFIFYISKFSISSITHACITLKWDLYVVNTIFDDIVTLIKSKDDYIGNHTLQLNINYHWSFCERICMLRYMGLTTNDYIRNHTLRLNENYHWFFYERIVGITLFYAYFWWGSRFQTLTLFDTNIEENYCYIDNMHDSNCYWFLKHDGFYASAYPNPSRDNVYFDTCSIQDIGGTRRAGA